MGIDGDEGSGVGFLAARGKEMGSKEETERWERAPCQLGLVRLGLGRPWMGC